MSTWTWVNTQRNCRWDTLSHIPISYYFFFPEQWHLLVPVSSSYGRWNRLWKASNRIEWRSGSLSLLEPGNYFRKASWIITINAEIHYVRCEQATCKYCLFHIHKELFTTKMLRDRVKEREESCTPELCYWQCSDLALWNSWFKHLADVPDVNKNFFHLGYCISTARPMSDPLSGFNLM